MTGLSSHITVSNVRSNRFAGTVKQEEVASFLATTLLMSNDPSNESTARILVTNYESKSECNVFVCGIRIRNIKRKYGDT